MKNTEIDYLDGEFQVQENEPDTLAELTAEFGEQMIVDETTSNLRYRNKYPRVYRKVSEAVVAAGFPKAIVSTKKLKDGTERKVHESENDHLRAFLNGRKDDAGTITEPAPDGSREKLQELFNSVATSEPLYVKGERTASGGGKVSQAALDSANGFFAKGDDAVETTISKIEELVPGYKIGRDAEGNPTVESVARGIMALNRHLAKQAAAQAASLLA